MNYLLHLLFSAPEPDCYVGNMLGDFVKGPLSAHEEAFSTAVLRGIYQHRRIDSFSQQNCVFRRSCSRLNRRYGLYRGIMVDLFYDHFTALNWDRYHSQPLPSFAGEIYSILANRTDLPPEFQAIVPRMRQYNWLVSYAHSTSIAKALANISQRAKASDPLDGAITELHRHYPELEHDCACFIAAATDWIGQQPSW